MTRDTEQFNPYACPEQPHRLERFRIAWVPLAMAAGASVLIITAGRRFLAVALDSRGLLAGVLLILIGSVVGRIIGTQPRARGMTMLASGIMFLGLVSGLVDHEGEERILWAFACMCGGLLFGTAYPRSPDKGGEGGGAMVSTHASAGEGGGEERRS